MVAEAITPGRRRVRGSSGAVRGRRVRAGSIARALFITLFTL